MKLQPSVLLLRILQDDGLTLNIFLYVLKMFRLVLKVTILCLLEGRIPSNCCKIL